MNSKRIFRGLLTIIGITILIYVAVLFVNTTGATRNVKAIAKYGILCIAFFIAVISLARTRKDNA
jgi:uncharacterized membrane protein YhaH (DUF805 family)